MTKISNNFLIGTVNKDLDERLVPMGQLTDAMNVSIITSEEGQKGVVKNAYGNVKQTDIANKFGITNPVTIHTTTHSSGNLIYNFVCGDNYDAIIEYNTLDTNPSTNTSRVIQSSTGGTLNFSKTHKIKASDLIVSSGTDGNLLAWTGDLNPPRIINIKRAKLQGVDYFTPLEISVIKPPPLNDISITMSQVGLEDGSNFVKDRFISFGYRYKYNDGFYSAISPWTEYCFIPGPFAIDYSSMENTGMENSINSIDVSYNTGSRDVVSIDLLFRESATSIVYIVDKFNKYDLGFGDNSIQTFNFTGNKIYGVLADAQYFRNYDNVPLIAHAQTMVGGRLLYGNFLEGRNLESLLQYEVAVTHDSYIGKTGSDLKSLHSNRDYEVAMIYMDAEGRKTTALVSKTNVINIKAENSDTINRLNVTMISDPPSWASHYKFAVKQIKGDYETIYTNNILEDPTNLGYRWLLLEGENKNKVHLNDELIVKADKNGPINGIRKVKALEVKEQVKDFLTNGTSIVSSQSGLYLKIKPIGFNIDADIPITVTASASAHNSPQVSLNMSTAIIPNGTIIAGSRIRVHVYSDEHSNGNAWEFDQYFTSNSSYATFHAWYVANFPLAWGTFDEDHIIDTWEGDNLIITSREGGYGSSGTRVLDVTITVTRSPMTIFETVPIESNAALFFESPVTYNVVDGKHHSGNSLNQNIHYLNDMWNCVCWGNGAESYKIKDKFNDKRLLLDFNPTAVTQDVYKQVDRFADLTYSEVFQESTGVNRLNEFNLYLANYKDDIQKSFGKIINIKGFDTNIDLIQEDKYSIVYYGKDLLYNADGSTNLQKIPEVLGQQKALEGEFGNQHYGSFDFYGFNRFFVDVKRCVVLQKSNNGPQGTSYTAHGAIEVVSNYGMNFDFTRLFADNTIDEILAAYDLYLNVYILNVKYTDKNSVKQYVTWLYSDESKGWVTKQSFNPEDITRLNGGLYSCSAGEIYSHNSSTHYNTFYNVHTPSSFSFNMNIEPGTRKVFRTLSTEGTDAWSASIVTDQQNGHIESSEWQLKEGVRYAYIRGDVDKTNQNIDTATQSVQGIGVVSSISGNNVLTGSAIPSIINIGDRVFKLDKTFIGNITNVTSNTIELDSVVGLSNGDFIFSTKPQSIETSGLLGYYMNVTLTLDKNTRSELYQVNSEVSKSFM